MGLWRAIKAVLAGHRLPAPVVIERPDPDGGRFPGLVDQGASLSFDINACRFRDGLLASRVRRLSSSAFVMKDCHRVVLEGERYRAVPRCRGAVKSTVVKGVVILILA